MRKAYETQLNTPFAERHIRVANIIEEGRYGGPHARILSTAKNLNKKGIDTIVVCPSKQSGQFQKKLSEENIEHYPIFFHRLTKHLPELICYLFFLF